MKNILSRAFIPLTIYVFAVTAFSQVSNTKGEVWKPVEVNGDAITITNAYLEILPGSRRFTGDTGCNRMSGDFTVKSRRSIDLHARVMTRRACKMMEGSVPEDSFVQALNDAVRYSRKGDSLDLFDRHRKRVVRFAATSKTSNEEPIEGNGAATLNNRKWFLESIANRKTFVAIKGVFINFDERKKSAGGDTGCNVFGGSYKAGKSSISIINTISTMRACVEDDGKMQTEREFLDGLREAKRYEISDEHLRLFSGAKLLLTFRAEPK
jgi:heat shock protein HslJ